MLWVVLVLLFVVIVGNWVRSEAEKARNEASGVRPQPGDPADRPPDA